MFYAPQATRHNTNSELRAKSEPCRESNSLPESAVAFLSSYQAVVACGAVTGLPCSYLVTYLIEGRRPKASPFARMGPDQAFHQRLAYPTGATGARVPARSKVFYTSEIGRNILLPKNIRFKILRKNIWPLKNEGTAFRRSAQSAKWSHIMLV